MSVLVTGANGFVGSALLPELILQGYDVKQLVRTKNSYGKPNIKTFCIDSIDNSVDFKKPLAGVDVVIHLAARVHVMREIYSDALNEYRKINVDATLNLARQAAYFGIKRFIFISSVKVNGELTEKNSQFTADDIPNPADAYSISKMEAESALIKLSKETNMEIVILRPPLIYGPGVKANFLSMMKLLYKNPPLPFGNIKNNRSFVYVYNLVDLILKVIKHPKAAGQIFLVSDDQDISTATLLRSTSFFLGKNIKLFPVPIFVLKAIFFLTGKKDFFQRLVASLSLDIRKTKQLLNWSPPYSYQEGIKATAEDFLQNIRKDALGK